MVKPKGDIAQEPISDNSRCSVRFPLRVHISPIDCNRFDFGIAGGAGAGFAVETDSELLAVPNARGALTSSGPKQNLLLHFGGIFAQRTGSSPSVHLSVSLPVYAADHSGLGSNAAVATACLAALNALAGDLLDDREIRSLVAANFVEEVGDGLEQGLETGVGPYVVLNGGIVLMADRATPAWSSHVLDGLPCVLGFPSVSRPETDRPESAEMLARSRALDAAYCYTRAYRFLMDFVPALESSDIEAAGSVVWDFQFSGTHQSMIQAYDDGGIMIMSALVALRRAGMSFVGMSSVGPTLYAVTDQPEIAEAVFQDLGVSSLRTRIASEGLSVAVG